MATKLKLNTHNKLINLNNLVNYMKYKKIILQNGENSDYEFYIFIKALFSQYRVYHGMVEYVFINEKLNTTTKYYKHHILNTN